MKRMRNNAGFSLLEAMMTSVAITVVGSIIIYALAAGITTYAASRDREDDCAPLRIAVARFERDLREVKSPADIIAATQDQLRYRDIAGHEVVYQCANGILRRDGQTLLADIAGFEFVYRDGSGNRLAAPAVAPNPTDVRTVCVRITMNAGDMKETIETTVSPRMLRD